MRLLKHFRKSIYVGLIASTVFSALVLVGGPSVPKTPQQDNKVFAGAIHDLNTQSTNRKRAVEQKAVVGPTSGNEHNLINIAPTAHPDVTDNGVIKRFWLALRPTTANAYPQFDMHIRVYYGGSATPAIDTDVGSFFAYARGEAFAAGNIHTEHFSAKNGGPANLDRAFGQITLPMPFENGIRIAVANVTNVGANAVFTQIDYELQSDNEGMVIPPYRLKVDGPAFIPNRPTANANADVTLATIPQGTEGIIVAHGMAGVHASNHSYLERQVAFYLNQEATPSIKSSGLEDYIGCSDYFYTGCTPFSFNWAMGLGSTTDHYSFSGLVDLAGMHGGYPFTDGAVVKLLQHPAVNTNFGYGSQLFWYEKQ